MTNINNPRRITAQIALEAIVNHPEEGYNLRDMQSVLRIALREGVGDLYLNMLREMIAAAIAEQNELYPY